MLFLSKYISRQGGNPSGIFGRFCMPSFFKWKNRRLNEFVASLICPGENAQVLEIGFGSGYLMFRLASLFKNIVIQGVDRSSAMIEIAEKRNARFISQGRLVIVCSDFRQLAADGERFDIIYTVNTIYFWQDPLLAVAAVYRLLKPEGLLYVGFHARQDMDQRRLDNDLFTLYSQDEVADLLRRGGFGDAVEVVASTARGRPCYCVIARKKAV